MLYSCIVIFLYVYNRCKSKNRFIFLILERVDFMSVHFSVKRPTRLKTNNIKDDGWKGSSQRLKKAEYLGEQATKAVRNAKKHLKELHKLYNDNEKKKNKNKLTKKDCEKERELADKIEGYISDVKKFIREHDEYINSHIDYFSIFYYNLFTNKLEVDRGYLHTMKSDTPREE